MPLLTARPQGRNDRHARIAVYENGGLAGVLTVQAESERAILDAINENTANRMAFLEEHIRRLERHAATQADISPSNLVWVGYQKALQGCLRELEVYDSARSDESKSLNQEPKP